MPRTVAAVPLYDDEGTIGVLQVLDKRGSESFSLRDMELLAVFAAQATAAITATRVQRGTARLMTHILEHVGDGTLTPDQVDVIVSDVTRGPGRPCRHAVLAPGRPRRSAAHAGRARPDAGRRHPERGRAPRGASAKAAVSGLDLPAWSEPFTDVAGLARRMRLRGISRDWAWGGSTGAGIRVGIVDSGLEVSHPRLNGRVVESVAVELVDGEPNVVPDDGADMYGHATACGGIILGMAPEVELVSIRVLGADLRGKGAAFAAGLEWAIENGIDVLNLSLSSKSEAMFSVFHDLVDQAYFRGIPLVSAANNVPAASYPSLFSAVLSVAAHGEPDPWRLYYNPVAAGRVRRLGGGRADRLEGRRLHGGHRQQLRRAARDGHGGADPVQASGADPVRGEVGAGGGGGQPAPRRPGRVRYSLRRRGARSRQASPITFSSSASSIAGSRTSTAG